MLVRVFRISQVFALLFAACAACASGAPNKRPALDLRAEKIEIIAPNGSTEDEIFALCANCEHGKRAKDKDGFEYIQRVDFESACLDCPVKAAEEARDEATAES